MAQQVCVVLSAAESEQLAAIAADRNPPRKHIERGRWSSPRQEGAEAGQGAVGVLQQSGSPGISRLGYAERICRVRVSNPDF
jgi:hypothetical protein